MRTPSKTLPNVGAVYRITNTENGAIYIGLTRQKRLCDRWAQHLQSAEKLRSTNKLANAIRKYGRGAFVMEHIASPLRTEWLGELESLLIQQHQSTQRNAGYNLSLGGESHKLRRLSEEGKANLRIARNKPEAKARNSKAQKLLTQSDEWRAHQARMVDAARRAKDKLSESRKAYASSEQGRAQVVDAARKGAQANKLASGKALWADGVLYASVADAAAAHLIERAAVRWRVKSQRFDGWRWADDDKNNPAANDGAAGELLRA